MQRAVSAAVVVTGDELLRGFVQDANTGFLARQLRALHVRCAGIRFCGDSLHEVQSALERSRDEHEADLLVVTGGLGPTHDDRTTEAVAAVTGATLELDARALEMVEERVRALGRMRTPDDTAVFASGNRKQATLPAGSVALEPKGTAPGYVLQVEGAPTFVVLPGPPSELRFAWRAAVATAPVQQVLAQVVREHERLLRAFGVPEAHAVAALERVGHRDSDASRVTLCARDGELELSVRGADVERVNAVTRKLADELGDAVFTLDDERPTSEIVGELLHGRGLTLAVAESCTGGMLASMLTETAGASGYFLGGVVTYSNELKQELLDVPADELREHGAVSELVARSMVDGVCARTGARAGVSITGVAGPGGGSQQKPVGTVFVATSLDGNVRVRRLQLAGGRDTIRRRSCVAALHILRTQVAETDGA